MPAGTINVGLVQAGTGTFTGSGNNQYSIMTSSGIRVGGSGGVKAAFFDGAHYGSGAGLTGVPGTYDNLGNHVATTTLNMKTYNIFSQANVTASSGTFTGTGSSVYGIDASSGIRSQAGNIYVGLGGYFVGDGSKLTNVQGDDLGNHVATTTLNMKTYNIFSQANITASSGTFTNTGTQYSIETSSGINVKTGNIYVASGWYFVGDGSKLTNIQDVALSSNVVLTINNQVISGTKTFISSITVNAIGSDGYSLKLSSGITMPAGTINAGLVQAGTGTFTGSGNNQYSIMTSSGIRVGGTGGVKAAFFDGAHYGSGAGLTGIAKGVNKSIQYNSGSQLQGEAEFVYSYSNNAVGIGTGTPSANLHIYGQDPTPLLIASHTTGGYGLIVSSWGSVSVGKAEPSIYGLDVSSDVNVSREYLIQRRTLAAMVGNFTVGPSLLLGGAGNSDITGLNNILVGEKAGELVTGGDFNVFIGLGAGRGNMAQGDDSSYNVYIGLNAGRYNRNAYKNVSIGSEAGFYNLDGGNNVYVGNGAGFGYSGSSSSSNTFVGANSGYNNDTGQSNAFFGYRSGYSNVTGSSNTFVGANTNTGSNYSNSIALGAGAVITGNNQLVIGSSQTSSWVNDIYIGEGVTSPSPSSTTINATGGQGAGVAGGHLILAGGKAGSGSAIGGSLIFKTAPNYSAGLLDRMVILSSGAVGISTGVPQATLHVSSGLGWRGDILIVSTGDASPHLFRVTGEGHVYARKFIGEMPIVPGGVNGSIQFNWGGDIKGNSTFIYNQTNNAVGIGTGTPRANLHIYGDGIVQQPLLIASHTTGGYGLVVSSWGSVSVGKVTPIVYGLDVSSDVNVSRAYLVRGSTIATMVGSNLLFGNAGNTTMTGQNNIFTGYEAGKNNADGSYNIFIGNQVGLSPQSGSHNIFTGNAAGFGSASVIGSYNIFTGYYTGYFNRGSGNILLGYQAGYGEPSISIGGYNIFLGKEAGYKNTIGFSNIAIGNNAGYNNVTGSSNTFLGAYTDVAGVSNWNYSIALGYGAIINASNQMVIGSSNTASGDTSIREIYVGRGVSAPSSGTVIISASGGDNIGGNKHGSSLVFAGGKPGSGGGGIGGALIFKTARDSGTGLLDRMILTSTASIEFNGLLMRMGSNAYGVQASTTHVNLGQYSRTGDYNLIADFPFATVGGGYQNTASSQSATVAGGMNNFASNIGAFVGGGRNNMALGEHSVIAGGGNSPISDRNIASGDFSSIGGGKKNAVFGAYSHVGGGNVNSANGEASVVVGGQNNEASGYMSFVGGGGFNKAGAGMFAVVGGGYYNEAIGQYSAVLGGENNIASGDYSFAGGYYSSSTAQGTFTWADYDGSMLGLVNNVPNKFLVRSMGGFEVRSSSVMFTAERVLINGTIRVGNDTSLTPLVAGTIKFDTDNFYGYNGLGWVQLDVTAFSGGGWTSASPFVSLTTPSDLVVIGLNPPTPQQSKLNIQGIGNAGMRYSLFVSTEPNTAGAVPNFVVDQVGNIGIGTSMPNARVDISTGGLILSPQQNPPPNMPGMMYFNTASNQFLGYNGMGWQPLGGGGVPGGNDTFVQFNDGGASFGGDSRFVYQKAQGKVGIGVSPQAKLHVVGLDNQPLFIASHTTGGYGLYVSSYGNVGIGTSNPLAKLDIHNARAADSYTLRVGSSATSYHLLVSTMGAVTIGKYIVRDMGDSPVSPITLFISDFGKTFTSTGTADIQYNLPSVSAIDIGAQFTIVRLGLGKVTILAGAGDKIMDSGFGATIYSNDASYASITLRLITETQWIIIGAVGTWTTTGP